MKISEIEFFQVLMSSTFEDNLLIINRIFGYFNSLLRMYLYSAFALTVFTAMLVYGPTAMTSATRPNIIHSPANKSSARTFLAFSIFMLMISHTISANNNLFMDLLMK